MKADIWPTEPPTTMSMPFIEIPQRDEASPSMTSKPAIAGGTRRFGRIAGDAHDARHHVLGNADAGMAMDDDLGFLVHAAAIEADMALDLDGATARRARRRSRAGLAGS